MAAAGAQGLVHYSIARSPRCAIITNGEIATDASTAFTQLAILGLANVAIDQLTTIAAVTAAPSNQMLAHLVTFSS